MNFPQKGDYIDIHVHGGTPGPGMFILEALMAHEDRIPENIPGVAFTFGIHPWFLNEENYAKQLEAVERVTAMPGIVAVGEAGFDRLKGPSMKLQSKVFEEQVRISEKLQIPLIIHCVRAWDELLAGAKKLKPEMPWMIHGYRGKIQQAGQLLSKGFWLSIWFEFAMRPESSELFRELPPGRFFLETDGADVSIKDIYKKVALDKRIDVEELKSDIFSNYITFFRQKTDIN